MQTPDEDTSLVRQALSLVKHVKSDREAGRFLGVAAKTVKEWREGKIPPLRSPMRDKLISKLSGGLPSGGYNEDREEAEMARIGGLPDPFLRIMERESIAAVIRAQGMRDACRAARLEAEKALDRTGLVPKRYARTPMKAQPQRTPRVDERKAK